MLEFQLLQSGAGTTIANYLSGSKTCKHCARELPLSEFYRSRGKYSSSCKQCHGLGVRTCRVCGNKFLGTVKKILCSDVCRKAYRPQTFKFCVHCGKLFGPLSRLAKRYCSLTCKHAGQRKAEPKPRSPATNQARAAHSIVARAIKTGKLHRPEFCSECGRCGRIEAAHHNYGAPLDVRWLCRSCHAKWDWSQPKGGTLRTLAIHPISQ